MEPAPPSDDLQRFRLTALGIVGASVVGLALYVLLQGMAAAGELALAATFVFLSKLAIFGGNIPQTRFNPWELALVAWMIDLWVSCALLAGIAGFERLPVAGAALTEARERADRTLQRYPGLRRLAFWGIALLVFLPIPGSGAVTGTLVGRLVGLSRLASLLAVAGGAGVAVLAYAAIAVFLGAQWEALLRNPWVLLASMAALALLLRLAWLRVRAEVLSDS